MKIKIKNYFLIDLYKKLLLYNNYLKKIANLIFTKIINYKIIFNFCMYKKKFNKKKLQKVIFVAKFIIKDKGIAHYIISKAIK